MNHPKKNKCFFIFPILLLTIFSFSLNAQSKSLIVTTFSPLQDIVKIISDSNFEILTLIPAGQDPHLFEPKPEILLQIKNAEIIIANGFEFEPWLNRLTKALNSEQKIKIVLAADTIVPIYFKTPRVKKHGSHLHSHSMDPHAWNSPKNILIYIKNIKTALCQLKPDQCKVFEENSISLSNRIQTIDSNYALKFDQLPPHKRYFFTTHGAAQYLANDYQLNTQSLVGVSTNQDIPTKDLNNYLRWIKAHNIKVLLAEPNQHLLLAKKMSQILNVTVGPVLYLDGLSEPTGPASNVEKMLEHNLSTIYKTLVLIP